MAAATYNASFDLYDPLPSTNLTLCPPEDLNDTLGRGTAINCSHSSSLSPSTEEDDVIWTPDVIQRVASLGFIMALTLVGNTAIILVLTCSRYRKRNSRVNLFIIHLAVGDLAVCVCTMTTEILFVAFGQWVLGPVACKILTYLQIVTLASTTFILTTMSFDRYLAICKPLKYRATTSRARKFIALSWLLAFMFAVPQLFIFVQTEEPQEDGTLEFGCKSRGYTEQWQRKVYFTFLTVYILLVPVVLITFCYTSIVCVVSRVGQDVQQSNLVNSSGLRRSVDNSTFPRAKIKTLKMTFAIIAIFVLCWTPYFVTTLIRIYSDYTIHIPAWLMAFAETIALLQSGLNPLLYGCFTVKIKRGLADVFCRYAFTSPRWGLSTNKSAGLTECYSMTQVHANLQPGGICSPPGVAEDSEGSGMFRGNCSSATTRMMLPPDRASNASNNSSGSTTAVVVNVSGGGGGGGGEGKTRVITEENKNGVRLRVRFAPPNKDTTGPPPSSWGGVQVCG